MVLYNQFTKNKKLYRIEDNCILAGVCSGLADYFDIDVILVRIIFVILAIGGGSGLLIYIILWIVTPEKESGVEIVNEESLKKMANEVGKKTKSMAKEIQKEIKVKRKSGSFLGIILVSFGVLIILEKFIPTIINWDYVWPIILIVCGGYLIFRE